MVTAAYNVLLDAVKEIFRYLSVQHYTLKEQKVATTLMDKRFQQLLLKMNYLNMLENIEDELTPPEISFRKNEQEKQKTTSSAPPPTALRLDSRKRSLEGTAKVNQPVNRQKSADSTIPLINLTDDAPPKKVMNMGNTRRPSDGNSPSAVNVNTSRPPPLQPSARFQSVRYQMKKNPNMQSRPAPARNPHPQNVRAPNPTRIQAKNMQQQQHSNPPRPPNSTPSPHSSNSPGSVFNNANFIASENGVTYVKSNLQQIGGNAPHEPSTSATQLNSPNASNSFRDPNGALKSPPPHQRKGQILLSPNAQPPFKVSFKNPLEKCRIPGCEKSYRKNFMQHCKHHHPELTPEDLEKYKKSRLLKECPIPSCNMRYIEGLEKHLKECHPNVNMEYLRLLKISENKDMGNVPVKCTVCGETMARKFLLRHLIVLHKFNMSLERNKNVYQNSLQQTQSRIIELTDDSDSSTTNTATTSGNGSIH